MDATFIGDIPLTPIGKGGIHTSPTLKKLMESVMRVQLAVGVIEKSKANPHFKSQYAPLDAIWSRATKACASEGIVVVQPATGSGVWTYVFHAPSGEWMASYMELPLVAPAAKDKETGEWRAGPVTPIVIGSITSYARRYSYLCALGLVAGEEDDDGTVSSGLPASAAAQSGMNPVMRGDPKEILRARKGAAIASLTEWLAGRVTGGITEAKVLEAMGDILGRPMDNLVLRDENELVCLEDWVKHLKDDTQGALPLPANEGKPSPKGK